MAAGKHRPLNPHRNKVGNVVAAGAVPLIPAIVGSGTANAAPAEVAPMTQQDGAPRAQWPAAAVVGAAANAFNAFNAQPRVVGD